MAVCTYDSKEDREHRHLSIGDNKLAVSTVAGHRYLPSNYIGKMLATTRAPKSSKARIIRYRYLSQVLSNMNHVQGSSRPDKSTRPAAP